MEASPSLHPPRQSLPQHSPNSKITEEQVRDSKSSLDDGTQSNIGTLPKDKVAAVSAASLNAPQSDGPSVEAHVDSAEKNSGPVTTPPTTVSEISRLQQTERRRTSSPSSCAMCQNYEHELQLVQLLQKENEKQLLATVNELAEKSQKLQDITSRHAELESSVDGRLESQQVKIVQLEDKMKQMITRFENLLANYRQHRRTTETEIDKLQKACEAEQADFQILQSHYDSLVGRRTRATAELSEQPINIPSDKTELELLTLKLYEENLALRAAREHLDDRLLGESGVTLQEEASGEPSSSGHQQRSRTECVQTLRRHLDETRAQLLQLTEAAAQRDAEAALRARCEDQIRELRTALAESLAKTAAKEAELATARFENERLQTRLFCLQNDLENIESVQADFVRLSQNLQMQLERLRQEETELRWVDPDCATACYACHTSFSLAGKKINCRHCGKVHCNKCLKQFTSPTIPGRRAQPVCDVCHTLLNKHVAPYFSTSLSNNNSSSSKYTNKEASPHR